MILESLLPRYGNFDLHRRSRGLKRGFYAYD